jgi:hypothetical protein
MTENKEYVVLKTPMEVTNELAIKILHRFLCFVVYVIVKLGIPVDGMRVFISLVNFVGVPRSTEKGIYCSSNEVCYCVEKHTNKHVYSKCEYGDCLNACVFITKCGTNFSQYCYVHTNEHLYHLTTKLEWWRNISEMLYNHEKSETRTWMINIWLRTMALLTNTQVKNEHDWLHKISYETIVGKFNNRLFPSRHSEGPAFIANVKAYTLEWERVILKVFVFRKIPTVLFTEIRKYIPILERIDDYYSELFLV